MIRKIPVDTDVFHYYNANPKARRTTDCVVRAIATATGEDWETVLRGLTEIAIKHAVMVGDVACYDRYLQERGWTKHKQPRKGDNTKYIGHEFAVLLSLRNYRDAERNENWQPIIANIGGGHVTCFMSDPVYRDYRVFDTWDCTNGCVGNYWVKG